MKKIGTKFTIKNPRKDGSCLIMARVYFKGKETRHSTGLYIQKEYWDEDENVPITVLAEKLKFAAKLDPEAKKTRSFVLKEMLKVQSLNPTFSQEMKAISAGLKEIELLVTSIYDDLPDKEKYNKTAVKQAIDSSLHPEKRIDKSPSEFYECFEEFIERGRLKKAPLTTKKYKTTLAKLREFEKKERYPIFFESIDMNFHDKYTAYLIKKKQKDDTIAKEISNIKAFMNWAFYRQMHTHDKYKAFSYKKTARLENIVLSPEEIEILKTKDLSEEKDRKTLEEVRDVFLFAYYTGQRYSDVLRYNKHDIRDGVWEIHQKKGKKTVQVPISHIPESIMILENYGYDLPVIKDYMFNRKIKDLGEICEFTEEYRKIRHSGNKEVVEEKPKYKFLSSHTARRSRITNLLLENISPAAIQLLVGHADMTTLMKYVNVGLEDLKKSLDTLQDKKVKKESQE